MADTANGANTTYTDSEKKEHIYELQNYLRTISRTDGNIPPIVPTGVYDEKTKEAVRQFQKTYGLPVTGKADRETWERIFEVYLAAEEYYAENTSIILFPNSDYLITEGMNGYPVYILQAVLNTIGQFYANISEIPMDGLYGNSTSDAVKRMQTIIGEESTGRVNYKTWNKLARIYNYHMIMFSGSRENE